jgi:DNA-binding HxlR family transcriptional regulator
MDGAISEPAWKQVPGLAALAEAMARDGHRRDDPMREIFARLGDRWSMLILLVLRTGTYRHAALKRLIGGLGAEGKISQRMLTLRLRGLERDGLVRQTHIPSKAPHVEYDLTPLGQELLAQVDRLMDWIRGHGDAIAQSRQAFDRRQNEE